MLLIAVATLNTALYARTPQKGYRGFIDWSNDLRSQQIWGGLDDRTTCFFTGVSTSHGYQIDPNFYVGAGLLFEHCSKIDANLLTAFLHGRADLKFGRFTPFGEIKLGFNMTDGGGLYFSPQIGYRFSWNRKFGINIGAGLSLQTYRMDLYDITLAPDGYTVFQKIGTSTDSRVYFSFSVGIDF